MSISVDVRFFRNGFDTGYIAYSRPVRQMASGLAGIVHNGRVYPLYRGDIARFEDITCSPSTCIGFFLDASEIKYHEEGTALIERWVHQDTWRGNYLSFDADDDVAAMLLAEIEAQIGPARLGLSFRPARDSAYYDWFIKLPKKATTADCERILGQFVSGRIDRADGAVSDIEVYSVAAAVTERSDIVDTEASHHKVFHKKNQEIAALEATIKHLETAKEQEIAQLKNELVRVTGVADAAKRKQLSMRSELVRLRQTQQASIARHIAENRPGTTKPEPQSEFKDWEDLVTESWAKVETLAAEKQAHLLEISNLEVELEMARSEIKRFKVEDAMSLDSGSTMAQRPISSSGGVAKRLQKHFVTALRILLPRLQMSNGDYEVLMNDFSDVEDIMLCLRQIAEGDLGPPKKFQGARNVFEYHKHLRTGESTRGRVYWRANSEGLEVAIEVKEDETSQERFVRGRFG